MSRPTKKLQLEQEPLWVESNAIAEFIYKLLPELPEDERWDLTSKLRQSAVNLLFSISEALGDARPATNEFEWGEARRYIASIKTLYRFAGRQHFIKIDPEMMVRFDGFMGSVDDRIQKAYDDTAEDRQNDLEVWRTKYQLWKEKTDETPR